MKKRRAGWPAQPVSQERVTTSDAEDDEEVAIEEAETTRASRDQEEQSTQRSDLTGSQEPDLDWRPNDRYWLVQAKARLGKGLPSQSTRSRAVTWSPVQDNKWRKLAMMVAGWDAANEWHRLFLLWRHQHFLGSRPVSRGGESTRVAEPMPWQLALPGHSQTIGSFVTLHHMINKGRTLIGWYQIQTRVLLIDYHNYFKAVCAERKIKYGELETNCKRCKDQSRAELIWQRLNQSPRGSTEGDIPTAVSRGGGSPARSTRPVPGFHQSVANRTRLVSDQGKIRHGNYCAHSNNGSHALPDRTGEFKINCVMDGDGRAF